MFSLSHLSSDLIINAHDIAPKAWPKLGSALSSLSCVIRSLAAHVDTRRRPSWGGACHAWSRQPLVDLLDVRPAAAAAARHAARHAAHAAAALRVERLHDGRADALDLLLLVLELLLLGERVALEPRERVVDGLLGLRLVVVRELVLELLVAERVLHRVAVVLQAVLRLDLLLELLVLLGVLL